MLFPSIFFIVYFLPAALLLYLACSFSRLAQNICLLALSLIFYAWGEPLHCIPLLFDILVAYGLGLLLERDRSKAYKKKITAFGVVLVIGMLFLARYGGGLLLQVGEWAGLSGLNWLSALPAPPLGVSFFSLQALAYIFDCAREKIRPERNILIIGLHIAFFPTILAGPVVRFADIAAHHGVGPAHQGDIGRAG